MKKKFDLNQSSQSINIFGHFIFSKHHTELKKVAQSLKNRPIPVTLPAAKVIGFDENYLERETL
jgi:hypothetical protein